MKTYSMNHDMFGKIARSIPGQPLDKVQEYIKSEFGLEQLAKYSYDYKVINEKNTWSFF